MIQMAPTSRAKLTMNRRGAVSKRAGRSKVRRNETGKNTDAKSVLDAGWGILKAQLHFKGQQAGRSVIIVSERDSTRTCSNCKVLTGPTGFARCKDLGVQCA